MILKGLGKVSLKIKPGNSVSIPGLPYGTLSYNNAHGAFACLATASGTYLAPRVIFPSVNPSDQIMTVSGLLKNSASNYVSPPGNVAYNGQIVAGISLQYQSPTNLLYEFMLEYLTNPVSPLRGPSQLFNPGEGTGNNAPTQIVGYGNIESDIPYGIASNYNNSIFYGVSQYGFNVISGTTPLTIPNSSTYAVNGQNFLAQNGNSYSTSVYYRGNLFGAVDTFTFDDSTLNETLPVSIKAQGPFFSLEIQEASGATHFLIVDSDITEYIEVIFDLSDVPSTLADGLGQNFFPSSDGLIYYSDDVQGIGDTANGQTWTPLYANLELPFPAPFDMASIQRTRLNIACCPTGDGHR